jgi:hypothetical protein
VIKGKRSSSIGADRTPGTILHILLAVRIPSLSPLSGLVVQALIQARGAFADATLFAHRLGLRDRHQLAYVLRRDGLKPLRVLASWIRLAVWLAEFEYDHRSLCSAALLEAQDPGSRYRLVKRLTGLEWSQVQARGLSWLIEELVGNCCQSRKRLQDSSRGYRQASSVAVLFASNGTDGPVLHSRR